MEILWNSFGILFEFLGILWGFMVGGVLIWNFFVNFQGILCEFLGNPLGILRKFFKNFIGILRKFFRNFIGILWEFLGNSLGILRKFVRNFIGILWGCRSASWGFLTLKNKRTLLGLNSPSSLILKGLHFFLFNLFRG